MIKTTDIKQDVCSVPVNMRSSSILVWSYQIVFFFKVLDVFTEVCQRLLQSCFGNAVIVFFSSKKLSNVSLEHSVSYLLKHIYFSKLGTFKYSPSKKKKMICEILIEITEQYFDRYLLNFKYSIIYACSIDLEINSKIFIYSRIIELSRRGIDLLQRNIDTSVYTFLVDIF